LPAQALVVQGMLLDHWVAALLAPLAYWVLINGIDDLFIDFAAIAGYLTLPRTPKESELDSVPERAMAIFVAAWQEHRVIRQMIENNVAKLRYRNVTFFIGAYPNDKPTLAAAKEAVRRHANVHLAVCPHDGPTSKADCLNWIYQGMLLHEEKTGVRFEMVLTHDAEDIVDPDGLRWINYYAQWNDMVQIPVLALYTPVWNITHGVYCDEFAEFQYRDMVARQRLGGFIPSNGVGTGFSRRALEGLAGRHANRIFEPACLTEDYENGFRIAAMGMPQHFVPIYFRHARPIATREFFPKAFCQAAKQRSRWITGIQLQSWQFHDAKETLRYWYWFWRDRKGLIGNLVSPLTDIVFAYGIATRLIAWWFHHEWGLAHELGPMSRLWDVGMNLQEVHTFFRMLFAGRIYGILHALTVPVRVIYANFLNGYATVLAIFGFGRAKLRGTQVRWAKTEHAYPNRAALLVDRARLGDVLVENRWLTQEQLGAALATKPPGRRFGEHLMALGLLTEEELYQALSLQNNLPLGKSAMDPIIVAITRSLPAAVSKKWRVLPFRIAGGELHLAGPNLPNDEMESAIRRFSSFDLRFHLVTPTDYEELSRQYLE